MNTVMVNEKVYEIIEDATDDVETVYGQNDTLQAFQILAVTGIGRSIENGKLYKIIWYLDEQDGSRLPEDASDWVSDWDTANETIELEEEY